MKKYDNIKKWFAVSDIHSYYEPLINSLINKGFDLNDESMGLIVCGDAFDRGDDTVKVFEFLKSLASQDRLVYIRGNHEDLLDDCLYEISLGRTPGSHHFSNGTVKTICMICGECEWIVYNPSNTNIELVRDKTKELVSFINDNCVDYFELGDKIFVHSWIPLKDSSWEYYFRAARYSGYDENWNADPKSLSSSELMVNRDRWKVARWVNPFMQWKDKNYPEDKTIVFGHWHCSEYWGTYKFERKPFPQKNSKDWLKSFEPAIDDHIIGIDACTAYSGIVNCVVFDEEGNLLND